MGLNSQWGRYRAVSCVQFENLLGACNENQKQFGCSTAG